MGMRVWIVAAVLLPLATCLRPAATRFGRVPRTSARCLSPAATTFGRVPRTSARQPTVCMGNPVSPTRFRYCTKSYLESTLKAPTLVSKVIDAGAPRWVTLLDEAFFLLASLMFVYASFDFYPGVPFAKYVEGCEIFIVGSIVYLALALFGIFEIVEDARLASRQPNPASVLESLLYVVSMHTHTHTHMHTEYMYMSMPTQPKRACPT